MNDNPQMPPEIPVSKTSGMAITSLVLGVFGFLCFLTSIPAIILGHIAHGKVKRSQGALSGSGFAIAGFITGYVSLAMIPVMLAIMLPAVNQGIMRGKLAATAGAGRAIAMSLDLLHGPFGAGEKADYANSTDVMKALMEKQVIGSGAVFSSQGIPSYDGSEPEGLLAENNAWCILADIGAKAPAKEPYLFTRNIRVNDISEFKGRLGDLLTDDPPFGKRGCVVITRSGTALSFFGSELNKDCSEYFNPREESVPVLRP